MTLQAPASCSWSVSSNASWISFPGTTTGTGNGTVAFTATANTATTQRNSYITAQRQSLPLVQESTAITIVGLSPAAATIAPSSAASLVLSVNDTKGSADISQVNVTIAGGTSPDCKIAAVSNGDTNDIDLYLSTNGTYSSAMRTGQAGTLSNSTCTIDVGKSSYLSKGKNATLTLAVSLPASLMGVHSITASAQGAADSSTVPVGLINVSTSAPVTKTLTIAPAAANAPLGGDQGTSVPFTISGTNTRFTAASTVSLSGTGVTVSKFSVVNATTVTGTLKIGAKAATGARTVTVATGPDVDTTTFTVNAATPTIALSPSSALKGDKVAVTITGTNTAFTAASTVAISGTRVKAEKVTYVSPTSITAEFVLETDAASDARTVTVTTGSEIDTATFTVLPDVTPEVTATPPTGNQGDSTFVTFAGIATHFTDATTVGIPGTDIKIKDINVVNGTTLTVKFVVDSTATAGARVVNITTGTEKVKGTFTVTAYAPTTTSIVARDAEIIETNGTVLTITVAPTTGTGTPTGYVSFVEHKGGAGLEDIVGTVPLSGGKASLPISNLSVGAHTFSAQYLGDNAAFAQSKSTVDAKVTVTADSGTVTLAETAGLQRLGDGSYEAIVTIVNSGTGTAKQVQMTSATLGGTAASAGSETSLPDIAPGASISSLSFFPTSTGASGTGSVLKFAGTYKGGNFSGSTRVTLP